ncbi:zinc finger protein 420 isoform X1 [Frankliniella occidentalis]|uniref:Zinc finger protein 420 isoform X1 n=1 Tax=Frankliniella occidentalis TaxID=133901 RepID=A0A6J1TKR3_FRAOC|nr:zinc finger protein 420 isoform X1 [Frankliniella occidentalis]
MQSLASNTSLCHQQGLQTNSWTELLQNFKKICRICGAQNDYLISIFGAEGETHSLDHKIHLYLQLQVRREDVLPSQLCYECMSSLLSWHLLYQNCQEAHHRFQKMLEKAEFPIRQESVLISPPKTLERFQISSHDYSKLSLPTDTQNDIHHGIDVTSQQHFPNTPHINVNQLVEDQENRLLSYEIKSDRHLQYHNLPEVETVDQNELDRVFVSEIPSSMPINSRVITNISHIVSNISNEIQYQEHAELSHTSTHNLENESDDEYGCISSHKKDSTVSTLRKTSKQNSFLKKKSSSLSSESRGMLPQSNDALRDDVMASQFTNRVSAIQLTTSSDSYQQESTCRSKSVLVRHESVHPSVLVSDNQNACHIAETEASTFIESAVIREHRNIGSLNNEGKGTMVSVVRPTCLRRAPTAVVVIENVSTKCNSESKEITAEDEEDKLYNMQTSSNNCIQDSSESKDAYTSSCNATSIRCTEGEAKGLDLSHICFLCKKFISNPVLLLSHEKSHLTDSNPPITFICKFCSHPQNSLHEMHLHYTIHEIEMGKLQKNYSNRRVYLCKQCGLVCATEERLAGHQRLHADSVESFRHECKTCGETFSTRSKLSVHLWTHALKPSLKTFKCHICGKGFGTKSSVMEHRLKHTEEEKSRAFKCVICSMAFGNNTLLGKHRLTHTQEELARPFKCTFCGKAFARNHTLQIHYLSHSNQKNHICNQCGKGFKMRNSLIQHMRTHQDPSVLPSYPCSLCGKNFKVKSRLRDHLRLHSGEKPFVCATCGKCFHKVTALHTHEISHTERRAFMCDVCGKAFKWSKNLRQHKSVHIDPNTSTAQPQPSTSSSNSSGCKLKSKPKQKLCQCGLCGKEFSSKASLRHHVRSIHDERENKSMKTTICSICGKELSNTAGLMRHMKITHGGEKAFKCDICSREYSTKVARDDHRRSHTGERPYTCSICPKTFSSLSNLHIHKASHSEDRPHKCSYCNKQFKRRAHLVPHIRTHTGEKPYVCDICSRGFAQSNDLHKHRLTHSNDKAFTCYCGQAYRIKRDLIRHQNKHHPHNLPPEAQPQVGSESLNTVVDISHQKQQIILTPGLPSASASSFNPNQTSDTNVISSSIIICNSMMQNKR